MSHPITVKHALGSYPVYVEPGILERLDSVLQQHLANGGLAIAAIHADLGVPGARTVELSAPQKALP